MAENLKVVSLGNIDEGRFMKQANEAFVKLQEEMVLFANEHGDKADKAMGGMVISLKVGCVNAKDGAFGLITQIKTVLPSPPAKATFAMASNRESAHPRLFCRPSGTGKDTPAQALLSTEDGRTVNPATGEVLDNVEEPEIVT